MIQIEEISQENWSNLLRQIEADDMETKQFLKEHEEEIIDKLLGKNEELTLDEKRKEYVRFIAGEYIEKTDFESAYHIIEDIRKSHNSSILQFGKRLQGSSSEVFEFDDKIIKFGKTFNIINNPNIVQPEKELDLEEGYRWMTVFERLPIVYTENDKDIAQTMYNRIRDDGMVWFDALGCNVGRTNKLRVANDDGLRIIDAQYMEYERDIFMRIQPEKSERYRKYGIAAYSIALNEYIEKNGYGAFERRYQEMKKERENVANKKEIETVAQKSTIGGLEKVKAFFRNLFHRKEDKEIDER